MIKWTKSQGNEFRLPYAYSKQRCVPQNGKQCQLYILHCSTPWSAGSGILGGDLRTVQCDTLYLSPEVVRIYIKNTPQFLAYSVQSLSHVQLFATPWTVAHQASLSITNSWSPPKLMSIESVMPSNHLNLCRPLLLLSSIFPSIRVFSNESVLRIRQPKYWSFSFNISPSNEYSGLISFGIDWLDFLAVQGTLKSLLQHHSLKASIRQCSALFTVQLSHPYMTTGKTIAR